MTSKKLPIGIQTFAKIREDDYYYVDKTGFARRLIDEGTPLLSVPPAPLRQVAVSRHPGGTVRRQRTAVSGAAYPRALGLADPLPDHPVQLRRRGRAAIRANWTTRFASNCSTSTRQALGLRCTRADIDGCFGELIRQAHAAAGQRVVVLVDEYDKPILDNLTRPDAARTLRDGLRNLYSVIKDSDAHIRFAFLTGVSKFSKVSIFSGLNNLNDITVVAATTRRSAATPRPMSTPSSPRNWTDWTGSRFATGTTATTGPARRSTTPSTCLLLFQERKFRPWWFETGTPTFLIDLLDRAPDLVRRTGATGDRRGAAVGLRRGRTFPPRR